MADDFLSIPARGRHGAGTGIILYPDAAAAGRPGYFLTAAGGAAVTTVLAFGAMNLASRISTR